MVTLITILTLIAAILLVLIVLIQKPKGGGISNNLTGANQIFGVKKTSDIVEKTTWVLSGVIAVLLLITTGFNTPVTKGDDVNLDPSAEIEKVLENPASVTQPSVAPPPQQGNPSGGAQLQPAPAPAPDQEK